MSHLRILLAFSLCGVLLARHTPQSSRRSSRNTQNLATSEYLMNIQCRARCLSEQQSLECDYEQCLSELRSTKKPGNCPKRREFVNETVNMLESNCIDACGNWDFNCPVEERCCPSLCGWSCQRPVDLERVKSLPPVPVKLSVMESRRKIEICWDVYAEIKVRNFVLRK